MTPLEFIIASNNVQLRIWRIRWQLASYKSQMANGLHWWLYVCTLAIMASVHTDIDAQLVIRTFRHTHQLIDESHDLIYKCFVNQVN